MEMTDKRRNDRNTNLASSSTITVDKVGLDISDAQLLSEFEKSGESFNYNASVSMVEGSNTIDRDVMSYYLSKIQRGGLIQPHGCMITVEEPTFKIIAYSENCCRLLGLEVLVGMVGSLLGVSVGSIFTPAFTSTLGVLARSADDVSKLNPLCVEFRGRSFNAILQRTEVGIMIDLEPAPSNHVMVNTIVTQKLAERSISKLQSMPGGDIGSLCDCLVKEIHNLTEHDRVMVYKFHDDEHGEVVSEIRASNMEDYSGLHYPATDIPQAARFLFKQSRVRMICDCRAEPVKVIQSETLAKPLLLVASGLRAPHDCHSSYMANMGSIASLVLAIVINQDEAPSKLWGLAVCHHRSPRYIPYILRQTVQSLVQAFSGQLQVELKLAAQKAEKEVLQMQTVLCDMLLRHSPTGIITKSPNMMDLVRCDGAAMLYGGKCYLLGVTPTESQLMDIVQWLMSAHKDSTGLTTDSLVEAGYPGAALLGGAVCGMATARIASSYFLFWFRSNAEKEIRWGGADQATELTGKMHPRSSFRAFLEVIRHKSLAWDPSEINAIHSLQLIMRDSDPEALMHPQPLDSAGRSFAELTSVASEMVRLIETAAAPIFGVDQCGLINGWNKKMVELTCLPASKALGKPLLEDVIHKDSRAAFQSVLSKALQGEEVQNIEVKLQNFQTQASNAAIYLVVNACTSKDYKNEVVGACFVGQDQTPVKLVQDNFIRLEGDYKAIVHSPNPMIPPVFSSDENGRCTEWNMAMERLTGFMKHEVIGKLLPWEIFGGLCHCKDNATATKLLTILRQAVDGTGSYMQILAFGFFDRKGKFVDVLLTANKRINERGDVVGCLCFLQDASADEQPHPSQPQQEEAGPISTVKNKEVDYICHKMKNPLHGIQYVNKILLEKAASDDVKKLLEASSACERQMMSLLEDINLGGVAEGKRRLKCEEFVLGKVLDAVVNQVQLLVIEKKLQLRVDIPEATETLVLFGDGIEIQTVLSDLLVSIAHYTPSDGWVEIKVCPGRKMVQGRHEYVHLQIRLTHSGEGIPEWLIEEMHGDKNNCSSEQSLILNICYNHVVNLMNDGRACYIREPDQCFFRLDLEIQTPTKLKGLF